ncbi:ABC transporter substrate-binding protein [Allofustis seminis]|uniref:ABC transporter substrate-binding protein n=1 Tax=Allofustis seminis TaxID=166939 RepID=UPI000377263D|nr:ABC transporter substrate-binding protein [Allofustis seminis]
MKNKMQKQWLKLLTFFAAVTVFLVGCGGKGGSNGGDGEPKVLKYGRSATQMTTLDGQLSTTADVIQPARLVAEPLYTYDKDMNLTPLLAEDLPKTEDNTTYTVKLKEGVKFHDGSELKADDVVFTFTRLYTPETMSTNTFIADMIKGAHALLEGEADALVGVRALDDYTVEFELEDAYAPFPYVLGSEMTMIYPKEATEKAGADWGVTTFVGTGPYKFDEFVAADHFKAVKNEDYHGGEVHLDEMWIYNMDENTLAMEYEAGNINSALISNKMAGNYADSADLHKIEAMGIFEVVFNTAMEPLNDKNVRKAFAMAVDKEALVNSFLQGNATPATSAIPPKVLGHTDRPLTPADPEGAKKLLADNGYPDGVKISTWVIEGNELADAAVVLQEQLSKAGIDMEVNLVDRATYLDKRNAGEIQTVFRNWYKDYPDPDNFLYTFFHSNATPNRTPDWGKPETDELLSEGRRLPMEKREAHYEKIDKILVEDEVATVPLYYPVFHYLMNENIEGIVYVDGLLDFTHANVVSK